MFNVLHGNDIKSVSEERKREKKKLRNKELYILFYINRKDKHIYIYIYIYKASESKQIDNYKLFNIITFMYLSS